MSSSDSFDLYEASEDRAQSIQINPLISSTKKYKDINLETYANGSALLFGPRCMGCQRHDMAAMISFAIDTGEQSTQKEFSSRIYDVFLSAEIAKTFLESMTAHTKSLERGFLLAIDRVLGQDTVRLRLDARRAERFVASVRIFAPDIRSFVRESEGHKMLPCRRKLPPSEKDIAELKTFLDTHYHNEPQNVPLNGIDPYLLFAALYNNAQTGGIGTVHWQDRIMHPQEAHHIFSELRRLDISPDFDTMNGRSIKICFSLDNQGEPCAIRFSRYKDYNGITAEEIMDCAQHNHYVRLSKQDILDMGTESDILMRKISDLPIDAQKEHITSQRRELSEKFPQNRAHYQLSIRQIGEVGHRLDPYLPVRAVPPKQERAPSPPEP